MVEKCEDAAGEGSQRHGPLTDMVYTPDIYQGVFCFCFFFFFCLLHKREKREDEEKQKKGKSDEK